MHRQFFTVEPTLVDFNHIWQQERIIKGGLVTVNAEEEAQAEHFRRHFDDVVCFSQARTPRYPDAVFNNILSPEVSKGTALKALAAYLGVALGEVMAVGDGTNDISLIKATKLGVAMGNAHSELKKVADYVTLDIDHSGLAAAISKFLG